MIPTYPQFVASLFGNRTSGADALIHATVGMLGEILEYRWAETREEALLELGDFEFYWVAACNQFPEADFPSSEGTGGNLEDRLNRITKLSARLLDRAKKCWAYNAPIEPGQFLPPLEIIRFHLDALYHILGTSHAEVIALNQQKLRRRYPAGYTDAAAAARADGAPQS